MKKVGVLLASLLCVSLCSCLKTSSDSNITQASVVGTWTLSYKWQDRTPGVLTIINFSDQTCLIPSGQNGGPTLIVTGLTSVNSNQFIWTFYNGSVTETYSGASTSSSSLKGTMTNTSGNLGTWTANESSSFITQASVVGTWTLSYKWQDRTPGILTVNNSADQTCKVPGGQSGGPSTTVSGTIVVNGNQFKWVWPADGSSWTGMATSSTIIWGKMVNNSGNSGFWEATKN